MTTLSRHLGGVALLVAPVAWLVALAFLHEEADATAPHEPQRVISVAPSLTEMVYLLGEGHRLVARSEFCDHPPAALALPSVGGFYDPRVEEIVRLRPDLVLCVEPQVWLLDRCRELGIPAVGIGTNSCDEILDGLRAVGVALGVGERAASVADGIEAQLLAETRVDLAEPRRVLWLHYRDPGALSGMIGLAAGGHTHELLQRAGYVNALAESPYMSPQLSPELILLLRPDVILDDATYSGQGFGDPEAARAVWDELLGHPQLGDCRVEFLTDDLPYRPGPRIVEGLVLLKELLDG